MYRFLCLCTLEALSGNAESLKEYRIGVEAFDKADSFDPRIDPTVRNEARRLRRKLDFYYVVKGKSDVVLIGLPKGVVRRCLHFANQQVTSQRNLLL